MLNESLLNGVTKFTTNYSNGSAERRRIFLLTVMIIVGHFVAVYHEDNTNILLLIWLAQVIAFLCTFRILVGGHYPCSIVTTQACIPHLTTVQTIQLIISFALILEPVFHFGLGFSLRVLDIYLLVIFGALAISYLILTVVQVIITRVVNCYTHTMSHIDCEKKCKRNMIVTKMERRLDNDIKDLEKSIAHGTHSVQTERLKSKIAGLLFLVIVIVCLWYLIHYHRLNQFKVRSRSMIPSGSLVF